MKNFINQFDGGINRRSFLKLSGQSAIAATAFGSFGSFADILQKEDHFFVVLKMEGGWDITLGLDPWKQATLPDPKDMFIEYGLSQTYQMNTLALGPSALPLKPFAKDMTTINGIFLSDKDNGHTASLNYMLTGKASNTANIEVELAHAGDRSGNFGILTNSNISTLQRNIPITEFSGIENAYQKNEDGSSLKAFLDFNTPKTALAQAQQFMANSSGSMRKLFKLLKAFDLDSDPELKEAKLLAASFLTQGAFNGHLDISDFQGGGLDTHSNHEGRHMTSQKNGFEKLAQILKFFKGTAYGNSGESLYDRTTFLVVSDFSRTAALNSAKGKDHNPMTNSALLLGKGVKGGMSIGESKLVTRKDSKIGDSYHIAKPFDFNTGMAINQRVEGAKFITPENIAMTLGEILKVDMEKFDAYAKDASAIKQIIS
jgi:hypothetical protein